MNSLTRIYVFHRNRLFRECLAQVLSHDSQRVAKPVEHDSVDYSLVLGDSPDVILVDLNLPDNSTLRLIEEAAKRETKVVILVPEDHDKLVECIAAGAHACVLERANLDELKPALDNVLRGQTYCSTDIVQSIYSQLKKLSREVTWRKNVSSAKLTARETEVLELMAERLSNKQIARRLSVSLYTVKNHVHSILEKLQVETRLDAIENAKERRFLDAR